MSIFRREAQRTGGSGMDLREYPKAASTVLLANSLVATNGSGKLIPVTVTTAPASIVGVVKRGVTATAPDYADETMLGVDEMSTEDDTFVADTSGSPVVGGSLKIGANAGVLSAAAATSGQFAPFKVKAVLPGGKAVVVIDRAAEAA